MDKIKYVVPMDGLIVRFPGTKTILPAVGAGVPWTGRDGSYWRRRLKDGSIQLAVFPKPLKSTKRKEEGSK